jgi:hypothetical protein
VLLQRVNCHRFFLFLHCPTIKFTGAKEQLGVLQIAPYTPKIVT